MGREVEQLSLIFLGSKGFGGHFWPLRSAASSHQELLTNPHYPIIASSHQELLTNPSKGVRGYGAGRATVFQWRERRKKPRIFSSRRPNSGESHNSFLNEHEAAALGDEDAEKTYVDLEGVMKRSRRKRVGNSTADDNKDVTLTARQRTMQSCKDAGSEVGANLIEFPEGLPQTSHRKGKIIGGSTAAEENRSSSEM